MLRNRQMCYVAVYLKCLDAIDYIESVKGTAPVAMGVTLETP